MCHKKVMFSTYFEEWDVKQEYKKEFVSLWPNWLGKDNLHKLDEVIKDDWAHFNQWITHLAQDFTIELVDCENSQLVLPELGCVISEEWDYTYITNINSELQRGTHNARTHR